MYSDPTLPPLPETEAVFRSLIREELKNGLGEFREGVNASLRHILREELLRQAYLTADISLKQSYLTSDLFDSDGVPAQPLGTPAPLLEASPLPQPDSLRQAAVADQALVLPGSIEEQPQSVVCQSVVCRCGSEFKDDAQFCRKCGLERPDPSEKQACSCGNIFFGDAQFCRKCGKTRPHLEGKDPDKPKTDDSRNSFCDNNNKAEVSDKKKKQNKGKKKNALFKQKDEPVVLSKLQRITHHKFYEIASGTLIVVNSLFLGIQVQLMATWQKNDADAGQPFRDTPGAFAVLKYIFTFLFSVELGLRWVAQGFCEFFKDADISWNILDVVVVGTSLLEIFLDVISAATGTEKSDALQNVSVLRVLRVIRIVRVARVIRVMKFFRELRMMIYSILGCVKNLMWVLVVLLLTFYIFGVGFTSAVSDYLDKPEKWGLKDNEAMINYFGTVELSIISLFQAMSGGNDWAEYYNSMADLPIWYRWAFLLFIVFCTFAVVNIVTGVFVESALQSNMKDRDIVVHEELHQKKQYLETMSEIFEEMDEEGNGTISLKEFEDKLMDERVIAYFNVLKLDVSDARVLFQLIDDDQSNEILVDEFLDGCYKLQGDARSLDIKIMQLEVTSVKDRVDDMGSILEALASKLQVKVVPRVHAPPDLFRGMAPRAPEDKH